MKRKNIQNKNGITISDSIVMSVKKKHDNYRKPFSAAIALIGYISIIMAFLGMFSFNYDKDTLTEISRKNILLLSKLHSEQVKKQNRLALSLCALGAFFIVLTIAVNNIWTADTLPKQIIDFVLDIASTVPLKSSAVESTRIASSACRSGSTGRFMSWSSRFFTSSSTCSNVSVLPFFSSSRKRLRARSSADAVR